jgi:hypothetical protein
VNKLEKIKWAATATLIVSVALNAANVYPLGPIIQVSGGVLWSWASLRMKDKPLIITNLVMTVLGASILLYNFLT